MDHLLQPLLNTTASTIHTLQPLINTALHTIPTPLQTLTINFFDFALSLETWYHGIPLLDIFFGLFAARNCKLSADKDINIVLLYISYILSTLGGSMLVSYWLSQPVGWLLIDLPIIVYTATFLVFQLPVISDIMLFITNNFIVQLIIQVFVDITWMTSITSYSFDNALKSPYNVRNSNLGPCIVAFFGGIGGPLVNQTLSLYRSKWQFTAPPLLSDNAIIRMVGLSVLTYYSMINHTGVLPYKPFTRYQARATVLCIILFGDTVLSNTAKLLSRRKLKTVPNTKKVN